MLVEGLGGGAPAERLAGSGVECGGDGLDVVAVPAGEVGALGEVLAQEAVGVLVGAALPWAVWVGEVDGETGVDFELGVLGEFFAAVPGQRAAQLRGQCCELRGQGVACRLCAVAGESGAVV